MDLYRDFPDEPGADVPAWDEQHDGYTSGEDRTLRIYRGAEEACTITAALVGLKIEMPGARPIKLIHGEPDVLIALERLVVVTNESLRREKALLEARKLRESGPPE